MCHDIANSRHTVLQRRSNRATQTGTLREGHEKSTEGRAERRAEERLIQRDRKQENEVADEKMGRDADRLGESG